MCELGNMIIILEINVVLKHDKIQAFYALSICTSIGCFTISVKTLLKTSFNEYIFIPRPYINDCLLTIVLKKIL